jgi:hypothetical protein
VKLDGKSRLNDMTDRLNLDEILVL